MVRWTSPAKNDLKKIYDYIASDTKYYAKKVVQDIVETTQKLNDFPEIGRMIPEFNDNKIRELIIYSYRLVYEVKNGDVDILAIVHGKRDFFSVCHPV
ncbi:type II toxin-antitoxin system mRNA interferase toxin, RelE/StbE family [Desulfatirhabdium butyrativorans]|uniref:type II toxin-antitoxin system RelE/ParE family toxin n=1 Tax=Desulfatirhabdium butyrativorans TaxID=340467 RepID=UPI0003F4DCF8|nr:type II toxin-antitoxin system mRNA interferase toxin, RelE/StbE family [Desulfatirhabdium butyrativorans]